MSLLSKILYYWHYTRRNYQQALLDSCLDEKIKAELRQKIDYHKKKIDQITTVKASC